MNVRGWVDSEKRAFAVTREVAWVLDIKLRRLKSKYSWFWQRMKWIVNFSMLFHGRLILQQEGNSNLVFSPHSFKWSVEGLITQKLILWLILKCGLIKYLAVEKCLEFHNKRIQYGTRGTTHKIPIRIFIFCKWTGFSSGRRRSQFLRFANRILAHKWHRFQADGAAVKKNKEQRNSLWWKCPN